MRTVMKRTSDTHSDTVLVVLVFLVNTTTTIREGKQGKEGLLFTSNNTEWCTFCSLHFSKGLKRRI